MAEGRPVSLSLDVIGAGRAGRAFALGLAAAGHDVPAPLGRGARTRDGVDAVLVCVPDSEIASVSAALPDGVIVGHCSGAHPATLIDRPVCFSLHPLMTLDGDPEAFRGAFASIDATSTGALGLAARIATDLGMEPLRVEPSQRAAYHAAASIACNFLTTIEGAAEELAASAGLPREALVPLVERTVANWARVGARESLTGPVARGDDATVARQRSEVASRTPHLLGLFDALCAATANLAGSEAAA